MKAISALQLILGVLLVSSCVSSKKYNELEAKYQKSNIEIQGSENRLDALKAENERLRREISQAQTDNKELKQQISQRENLKIQQLDEWRQKYDNLNMAYQQLLQNSTQEANINRQIIEQKNTQLSQVNTGSNNNPQNPFENNNPNPFSTTNNNPQNPFGNSNNNPVYTSSGNLTTSNTSLENKSFNNTSLNNSNLENTDYSGELSNQAALMSLQNQLLYVMGDFQKDEATIEMNNGNLYLNFADPILFSNQKYDISTKGLQTLKNIASILKNNPGVSISLVSEDNQADTNPDGLLKSQSIARLLQAEGLPYKFHKKNFAPLAFDTTGTEAKTPHTSMIIQIK